MATKRFPDYKPTEFEAPQRNVLQEGREGLQLMREAYPQILDLYRQYGPQFARAEVDTAGARASAEQAAVTGMYPGFRDALMKASPEVRTATDSVMARFGELGASGVEQELQRQALSELRLGGRLSAEDERGAAQSARAAWSARGLATSSPAAIAEVMNRQSLVDARRRERQGFASGVDAQRTARKASDAATANNLFNSVGAFWDPQQRLFGRGGSMTSGQVQAPNSYNPFLGASQEVGRGNQVAALETNRLNQMGEQFAQERLDTQWYTLFNAGETNRNAAAQRSNATTNAAVGATASVLAMAALAFL